MAQNQDDARHTLKGVLADLGKGHEVLRATGGSDEAIAFIEHAGSAMEDLVLHGTCPLTVEQAAEIAFTMSGPLSSDADFEIAQANLRSYGMDLDYERTGELSIDVSPEAQLRAAEELGARKFERDDWAASVKRAEAVSACILLVRDAGAEGVIFTELAEACVRLGLARLGNETILLDDHHPNAVCWSNTSREFLEVIDTMLQHPAVQMVRATAQRYHNTCGPAVEMTLDFDDATPMPEVEGEIAEGGYATPHWVPMIFVWNETARR